MRPVLEVRVSNVSNTTKNAQQFHSYSPNVVTMSDSWKCSFPNSGHRNTILLSALVEHLLHFYKLIILNEMAIVLVFYKSTHHRNTVQRQGLLDGWKASFLKSALSWACGHTEGGALGLHTALPLQIPSPGEHWLSGHQIQYYWQSLLTFDWEEKN